MNLFKSVVASAISSGIPNFPYTFGDRQDIEGGIWVLQNGQKRVGNQKYTNDALLMMLHRTMGPTAVYSPSISMPTNLGFLLHETP